MVNETNSDIFISHELKYYNLSNLFFDTPIREKDIDQLKQIFFSLNSITQIYFRKNIDIKSIETVKYLLEISPTMTDSLVEKYIFDLEDEDLKKICEINFMNPITWFVSFRELNFEYKTISIDKYRDFTKYVDLFLLNLERTEKSNIEKIRYTYDFCKKMTYCEEKTDLLNTIKNKKSDCNNFSILFQYLLRKQNINSFIGKTTTDSREHYVVIADIIDSKYQINGIYLFDPFSDNISYEEVKDKELIGINYNFFAIRLCDYENTVFLDKFIDILSCFMHDEEYDLEKIKYISKKNINDLEKTFGIPFLEIHKKIRETPLIDDNKKIKIITSDYKPNLSDIIIKNYKKRNSEIFYSDELEKYLKI